jgi:pimeloyl-ACP methyl ester carboxylesterase
MRFYSNGEVRLHYVVRGAPVDGSVNTVLFQHGIGGDIQQPSRFLVPERTGIPAGEFSLLHTDFRGHGQSDLGPIGKLSIETLAYDLVALLYRLDIPPAIVGGISMGAAAALRLAVDHPERCRALILCRPAWTEGPMSVEARRALSLVASLLAAEDWQSSAAEALERSEIIREIEQACPDAAKSIRGQLNSVLRAPETRNRAIARLSYLPFSGGLADPGDLAKVRCPTLILAAEGDPIHPFAFAQWLADGLPNCRLECITPKSAFNDAPHLDEVDRIAGTFLREQLLPDLVMR